MIEDSQFPPGSQAAKTLAECDKVVKGLVTGGNPKSNLFAMCIICNAEERTFFSVKAVDTLTREDVLKEIQEIVDYMKRQLNESN